VERIETILMEGMDIAPDERKTKLKRAMEQAERLAESMLIGDCPIIA
jgi:FMN-dependent NADH-azoreductase